jgi:hypothetical protein
MLTAHSVELLALLSEELKKSGPAISAPSNGKKAAIVTVDLMQRAFKTIQPMKIVDAFVAEKDLWKLFKSETVTLIADGSRTLAAIWRGAWNKGGGNAIADNKLVAAATGDLMALYNNADFVRSLRIQDIKAVLK